MKHLKKFESIKKENKILDNLNKEKLSKSEKEFMDDYSNDKIEDVSIPNPSGNLFQDMANPHNMSIMVKRNPQVQLIQ